MRLKAILALLLFAVAVFPAHLHAAAKKKKSVPKTPVDSTVYLKFVQPDHIDVIVKGEKRSYRIDGLTAVYLQGNLASVADLKPGMPLDIPPAATGSYVGRIVCNRPVLLNPDKITTPAAKTNGLVIQSIAPDRITVTSKGQDVSYRINESTTVYLRDELASMSDLKPGMSVNFAPVPPGSYIGKITSNDFASPTEPGPKPKAKKENQDKIPQNMKWSPGGSPSTATQSTQGETRPSRKHPAHPPVVEPFNRAIIIFVTVCTKDRQPVLATPGMHDLLHRAWDMAGHWKVGRYAIMPDHIHLFCAPGIWPTMPVKQWVEYWKSLVARAIKGYGPLCQSGAGGTTPSSTIPGGTASTPSNPLWQRDFWDTQLRQGESYSAKWDYVRLNPVRAGLCSTPEDWPYQGEINVLQWHD